MNWYSIACGAEASFTPASAASRSYAERPGSISPVSTFSTESSQEGRSGWSSFSSEASPKRIRAGTSALRRKLSRTLTKSLDNLKAIRSTSDDSWESNFSVSSYLDEGARHSSSTTDTAGNSRLPYRGSLYSLEPQRSSVELDHCRSATSELESLVHSFGAERAKKASKDSEESDTTACKDFGRRSISLDAFPTSATSSQPTPFRSSSIFPASLTSSRSDSEKTDRSLGLLSPDSNPLHRLRHAPTLDDIRGGVKASENLTSSTSSSLISQQHTYFHSSMYNDLRRTSSSSTHSESDTSFKGQGVDSMEYFRPSVSDRMMEEIGKLLLYCLRSAIDSHRHYRLSSESSAFGSSNFTSLNLHIYFHTLLPKPFNH